MDTGKQKMIHLITGGSASGKSAYAEAQAVAAGEARYYIATMRPYGAEGEMRVAKHRRLRAGKGFSTIECYTELAGVSLERGESSPAGADDGQWNSEGSPAGADGARRVILLECMSNLVANELFDVGGSDEEICRRILAGIRHLQNQAKHLIIVTNEVFSDGLDYDPETVRYIRLLGRINRLLAERAGQVTEVVYGIPVERKPCPREKGKGPEFNAADRV